MSSVPPLLPKVSVPEDIRPLTVEEGFSLMVPPLMVTSRLKPVKL